MLSWAVGAGGALARLGARSCGTADAPQQPRGDSAVPSPTMATPGAAEGKPKLSEIFPEKHHPVQVWGSPPLPFKFLNMYFFKRNPWFYTWKHELFWILPIPFQRYRKMLWIDAGCDIGLVPLCIPDDPFWVFSPKIQQCSACRWGRHHRQERAALMQLLRAKAFKFLTTTQLLRDLQA